MSRPTAKSKKTAAKPLAAAKPATKRSSPIEVAAAPPFRPRDCVTHRTFGPGVVQSVDSDKLQIKFAKVGVKWIIDCYVTRG
jgi:hypothetical protein